MKATEALKHAVLIRTNEIDTDGYHQTIMNIMYEQWQKEDAMSYHDILKWFETTYGSLAKFAVLIGKYNQQVCNGGHIQYFHNGYADGEGGFMNDHDPSSPLHSELISLYQHLCTCIPSDSKDDKECNVFDSHESPILTMDNCV